MKGFIITLVWLFLIGWACLAFCGCAYTINADGTRTFSLDGEQAVRAIEQFSK